MDKSTRKRICWVTATYFLDVDLPVVPKLMDSYNIDWYIITSDTNRKSDEEYVRSQASSKFSILTEQGSFFSIKRYYFYKRFIKSISSKKYDLYYFDITDYFFLFRLIYNKLPNDRVIVAVHNVSTPKGARLAMLAKMYVRYVINHFSNFHVFSKNQESVLKSRCPNSSILYCPLMLKDYGNNDAHIDSDKVRFLFFGNILRYKRLDILLEAVNILEANGAQNFIVRICGYCNKDLWKSKYLPLISSSKVECDIRRIPNEIVSEYFNDSDFFVMPYQDIAQSGAMTVAFNYNVPVIASDLDTFKEFLNDGIDGFFFQSGNSDDLAKVMLNAINLSCKGYEKLKKNQRRMVERLLSTDVILNAYKEFFNLKLNAESCN